MRYLLLLLLRLYGLLPLWLKGTCLFRESCTDYLYRQVEEEGLSAAWRAWGERRKKCREGYLVFRDHNEEELVLLADLTVVPRQETLL